MRSNPTEHTPADATHALPVGDVTELPSGEGWLRWLAAEGGSHPAVGELPAPHARELSEAEAWRVLVDEFDMAHLRRPAAVPVLDFGALALEAPGALR